MTYPKSYMWEQTQYFLKIRVLQIIFEWIEWNKIAKMCIRKLAPNNINTNFNLGKSEKWMKTWKLIAEKLMWFEIQRQADSNKNINDGD